MGKRKTIEKEINDFLEDWDIRYLTTFLKDVIPLLELYDVEKEDDWVVKEVGGDEMHVLTVRLVRTVYLVSRIAEFHAGKLSSIKVNFNNLWKRMEKEVDTPSITTENLQKSIL